MKPISNTSKDIIAREEVQEASNPTFTEASERTNIASGESLPTLFGKIKKFFTDLKAVAFSGSYNDLDDKPTIPTDFVSKANGGTFNGSIAVDRQNGTTSAVGNSYVILGNNISQGTAKNSRGVLQLYGLNSYVAQIYDNDGMTANRNLYLPDKSGTIALTSDNSASAFTLSSGEIGNKSYASNDSHIMLLCTITLGDYYEYLSLLITSSFWGNQHGSADIINIQASVGSSASETPFTIYRVGLGGRGGNGDNRSFYYGSSGNTVYLYVYVTSGNGYGGWNISCLKQRNCSYVVNGTTNVSPSSVTPVSLGGRINYAERSNSDDEGNRIVISYGASLGYSSGTLFLYNKSGIKISQVTISTSSRKFKRNIEPLSETEAKKILDIETVTFDYTEEKDNYTSRKGYKNIGCIAEDVNEIIPELVTEDDEGNVYGVNYMEMIPYLIKMVQMQQEEIDNLKAEISALKK